jgi:phosphatidylglycerol---prolipoprotein diacylglyceryl transferase
MLPRLIELGPFTLYSFGLMVVVGFSLGIMLAGRLARERGLPGDAFMDGAVLILFASIAGARLLFVALHWREYAPHAGASLAIWQGGMSFHGGAGAGVAAGLLYMWRRRLPMLAMADAAAPALALGYAVGRLGCLLNGCCYGVPTTLPWALPGVYCQDADRSLSYHPTQVYSALIGLVLMAGLVHAYRRPHRVGQVMALFLGGYSVYRFGIEALRAGVTAKVLPVGLTEAQVFSLFAVAAAAAWWLWLQKRSAPAPLPAPEPEPGSEPAAPRAPSGARQPGGETP